MTSEAKTIKLSAIICSRCVEPQVIHQNGINSVLQPFIDIDIYFSDPQIIIDPNYHCTCVGHFQISKEKKSEIWSLFEYCSASLV